MDIEKYNDEYGFEDVNTPELFDQLESQALIGSKNRYIYDFSSYVGPANQMNLSGAHDAYIASAYVGLPGYETTFITKNQQPVWLTENVISFNESVALHQSLYGNTGIIYQDSMVIDDTRSVWPTLQVDNLGFDQDGSPINHYLPYFNEDAIGFINQSIFGLYGNASPSNDVDFFRSGYVELSFKTNKKNMTLAYGSGSASVGSLSNAIVQTGEFIEFGVGDKSNIATFPSAVDYPNYYREDRSPYSATTEINLKDGKLQLHHFDQFGEDHMDLYFEGIKDLADDKWHHVVVNFGRPGIIKEHGSKFAEKYIEFWVDGKLDKRFYNENKRHIFYVSLKWILGNPNELINKAMEVFPKSYNDYDQIKNEVTIYQDYIGTSGKYDALQKALNLGVGNNNSLFVGSMRTYAHGINIPLDKYEIQFRHKLWNSGARIYDPVKIFSAEAKMINPTVLTNKKKALKLFWNKIDANNGIELDNNFVVDSYCMTHKIKNSPTETFNYDLSKKSALIQKSDVKVALFDNVLIWGPGKISIGNTLEAVALPPTQPIEGRNQYHGAGRGQYDSVTTVESLKQTAGDSFVGPITDLFISGITLIKGDRILLANQIKSRENGIWIFNGLGLPLTRPDDFNSPNNINNSAVYVTDGYYAKKYFYLSNILETMDNGQIWNYVDDLKTDHIYSHPTIEDRWTTEEGNIRFIDLQSDININNYDLIVFMNYPTNSEEIKSQFTSESNSYVTKIYNNFIKSLQNVCAQGASLYVSSPKLAEDLGIVKKFTQISQEVEISDAQSAALNPFEINEPADRYFDTHRNNKYELAVPIAGLTNKQTYILTDFINYNPDNNYDYEQYHAKYAYRQFGLQEGNEFIIPGLSLRKITTNENLPGFVQNQRTTDTLAVVAPSDILAGTVVTKLANTYYTGSTVVNNPYDDYASTIIVYNNQVLGGQPITGKIFVNCVEDGYTFSRQEYNKAVIQVIPTPDANETTATRGWQYSTSRLNRLPQRINVRELTELGQTTPTNGGGGPFIQAQSNSSNGIIRSKTDLGNINYQSDLYASEAEEIYPIQEIPVLSMTWLGLQWLAE